MLRGFLDFWVITGGLMQFENEEYRVCKVCGRELPITRFDYMKPKKGKPYYISTCKACRNEGRVKKKNELTKNVEILINRSYKKISDKRILKITKDMNVNLLGDDEIFVKLMDYKNTWISNYGQMIKLLNGRYELIKGRTDKYGNTKYKVLKDTFSDGVWRYKRRELFAAKLVAETFIINPDVENNKFIWHKSNDKRDCYYKNLYPLNREQYRIVKSYYMKEGIDPEDFIIRVLNDIKFKPDNWSKRRMKPIMSDYGYIGSEGVDRESRAYTRWHDMLSRCYNSKFHERQPQYEACEVCEEWLNFSNFKVWYDEQCYDDNLDLDKDILIKGNTVYSPATCCFVPHMINTLFSPQKKCRGKYPLGVYWDSDSKKFCSSMNLMEKHINLGRYDTVEEAFQKYKIYKENFIKNIAEKNKGKIPNKVYEAMMGWIIEIDD